MNFTRYLSKEAVEALPTPELERYRDYTERRLADIRTQLDTAKSRVHIDGVYADADWYRRAEAARRMAGVEHQTVLRLLGERKRAAKQQAHQRSQELQGRRFIEVARRWLEPDVFIAIMREATETIAESEKTA